MTRHRHPRTILVLLILVFLGWRADGQDPAGFGCPMHPEIRAASPGPCSRCGMALVPMGPVGAPAYRVAVSSIPATPSAGVRVRLEFAITHPTTGAAVSDLSIVHEMPFHLFIVGDDLETYDHIHPMANDNGRFVVDTSFPKPGTYHLYCDFLPVGGAPQVVHLRLTTADAPLGAGVPTRLTPDTKLTKTVNGMRFALTLEPPRLAAGKAAALIYRVSDEKTGEPVTDLQPYLGAWGHTLILSEDAERYLHSHPTRMVPAGGGPVPSGGPEVSFNATLKRPGVHRLWSQFQRGGKVTTVSFTLDVAQVDHLAAWNGAAWTQLGGRGPGGPNGTVRALAVRGGEVFAGGEFTAVGTEDARGIARWDGRRWRALGGGVDGMVRAIGIAGGLVYVGGEFTNAGAVPAGGIARWDGTSWSALAGGVSGSRDPVRPAAVHAIAIRGREVYVGGRFVNAGGVAANGIARWDGQRFTPLSSGLRSGDFDGVVWALAFFKGELYVGGQFVSAGGVVARNVARWDGRTFHALGDGVAGGLERVSALAGSGGRLYVGGDFTMAGGIAASQLAAWDGSEWSAAGVKTSESVRAIAAAGADVYVAGGTFATASGVSTNGIVRWNGRAWTPLGEGLGSGSFLAPVLAIAPSGRAVYAGGGPFIVR